MESNKKNIGIFTAYQFKKILKSSFRLYAQHISSYGTLWFTFMNVLDMHFLQDVGSYMTYLIATQMKNILDLVIAFIYFLCHILPPFFILQTPLSNQFWLIQKSRFFFSIFSCQGRMKISKWLVLSRSFQMELITQINEKLFLLFLLTRLLL